MSIVLQKNIQLSEKIDFLQQRGYLTAIETKDGMVRSFVPDKCFQSQFGSKAYQKISCRLIEFVNEIFGANELLYVMLQRSLVIEDED